MKITPREIAHEICRKYDIALDRESIEALASILVPVHLIRGKEIVTRGSVCDSMYYVHEGLLLETYPKDGVTITKHIIHESDVFTAVSSYITGEPAYQTISVLEPVMMFRILRKDMMRIAQTSFGLCRLQFAIYERFMLDADHWDYDMKFASAQERYERALKSNPEIVLRSPIHNIASLLAMKPETLSRVRSLVHKDEREL